jgi:hypothetical protein
VTTERESSNRRLLEVLATLEPIEEDFPEIEELPVEPVELDFDVDPATDDAFRELIRFLSSGRDYPKEVK